jgi:hypothetical protein
MYGMDDYHLKKEFKWPVVLEPIVQGLVFEELTRFLIKDEAGLTM